MIFCLTLFYFTQEPNSSKPIPVALASISTIQFRPSDSQFYWSKFLLNISKLESLEKTNGKIFHCNSKKLDEKFYCCAQVNPNFQKSKLQKQTNENIGQYTVVLSPPL